MEQAAVSLPQGAKSLEAIFIPMNRQAWNRTNTKVPGAVIGLSFENMPYLEFH